MAKITVVWEKRIEHKLVGCEYTTEVVEVEVAGNASLGEIDRAVQKIVEDDCDDYCGITEIIRDGKTVWIEGSIFQGLS